MHKSELSVVNLLKPLEEGFHQNNNQFDRSETM